MKRQKHQGKSPEDLLKIGMVELSGDRGFKFVCWLRKGKSALFQSDDFTCKILYGQGLKRYIKALMYDASRRGEKVQPLNEDDFRPRSRLEVSTDEVMMADWLMKQFEARTGWAVEC